MPLTSFHMSATCSPVRESAQLAACCTADLLTHVLADVEKAGGTAVAMQVMDNWEGQPGAAVLTKGATASRERRLLEWANDMEALVNTQVGAVLAVICTRLQILQHAVLAAAVLLSQATDYFSQATQELCNSCVCFINPPRQALRPWCHWPLLCWPTRAMCCTAQDVSLAASLGVSPLAASEQQSPAEE